MSDNNPNFHNRRSIRLKGYDYSQAGLYFITMCLQNRECLFGEIVDSSVWANVGAGVGAGLRARPVSTPKGDHVEISKGDHAGSPQRRQMILNDAGKMIEKWYAELENKYPNIRCHEMVVMPNHFHCIIEITGMDSVSGVITEMDSIQGAHVGAPLRGRPDDPTKCDPDDPTKCDPDDPTKCDPDDPTKNIPIGQIKYGPDNKKYDPVIGDIVGWLKTMTTNEYIHGVKKLGWQRFDGKLWQRDYWEHIIRDEDEYIRISNYIINNPEKWNEDQLNPYM